jgi:O-antigen ligase
VTAAARALRVLVGVVLAWLVFIAAVAPEVPWPAVGASAAIAAATLWSAPAGLALTAALAPAAQLLAGAPVRTVEMFAWSFLAAWLLAVWRPLSRSRLPRAVMIPAALYGAAVIASWFMLTMSTAAGVAALALPEFLFHSIPLDHLVFSSPEPETWTLLQTTTGIAMLVASMATMAARPHVVRAVAWALVFSVGFLAAATLFDVARQWSGVNYEGWFLMRYVRGERFALHLADLNAAGSLYLLGGIVAAAAAALDPRRRGLAIAMLSLIAPAFWLTGSRSSDVAAVVGVLLLAVAQQQRPLTRTQLTTALVSILLLTLAAASIVDWQSDAQGSAARSAGLRFQFTQTSTRMFASAPAFGVGVGRYFDRSAEFMPADLRSIYGNENAHNYFLQQFAELGVVGGALFVWLACSLVAVGWRAARTAGDVSAIGLFGGVTAYLLTCVTGHPLLVPETAVPLWIAAGALTGGVEHDRAKWSTAERALAAVACVALVAGGGRGMLFYARATAMPPEYGFHGQETGPDGSTFRWMTRHAVTYIPNEIGFVRLRLRVPEFQTARPLVVETAIAGEVADRRELPAGRWVSYDIPSRRSAAAPFRRVDLRANQWWTQEVPLGARQARRPVTVMVAGIEWIPLDAGR